MVKVRLFFFLKLHSWLLASSLLWHHLAWIKCYLQFQPLLFEFPVLVVKKFYRRGKLLIRGKGLHSFSALHCASLDIQFHLPAHHLLPPRKLVQVALSIAKFSIIFFVYFLLRYLVLSMYCLIFYISMVFEKYHII